METTESVPWLEAGDDLSMTLGTISAPLSLFLPVYPEGFLYQHHHKAVPYGSSETMEPSDYRPQNHG